jgi:hypothetical protein
MRDESIPELLSIVSDYLKSDASIERYSEARDKLISVTKSTAESDVQRLAAELAKVVRQVRQLKLAHTDELSGSDAKHIQAPGAQGGCRLQNSFGCHGAMQRFEGING